MINKISFGTLLMVLLGFQVACTTGSCRQQERAKKELERSGQPTVKVYKYDGSKQCEGGGVAPENMIKDFGDIKVISSTKKPDGMMRTQSCGSDTGMANVFEIRGEDLAEAEKRGFRVWRFE